MALGRGGTRLACCIEALSGSGLVELNSRGRQNVLKPVGGDGRSGVACPPPSSDVHAVMLLLHLLCVDVHNVQLPGGWLGSAEKAVGSRMMGVGLGRRVGMPVAGCVRHPFIHQAKVPA